MSGLRVGKNWKWVAGAVAGILLLNPILNIIGAIGGAIALIRTAVDIFSWARNKMFPKTPLILRNHLLQVPDQEPYVVDSVVDQDLDLLVDIDYQEEQDFC